MSVTSPALDQLLEDARDAIEGADSLASLESLRVGYLGKKGVITEQLKSIGSLPAEQRKDFSEAHRYWSLLLPLVAEDAAATNEIRGLLASLEQRDPSLAMVAGARRELSLHIDIDPALRARANDQTAVFVYARAMQGPPMPLAVKRLQLKDLPLTLSLGDADAMMPSMKLSSYDQVVVGARVSFSGNPVGQSGDFFTELESVDSTNPPERIDLTIDTVKP